MKKIIVCFVFAGLLFSCKKDKKDPAPVNTTPTTPAADGSPSSATQFFGIFKTQEISDIYTTSTSNFTNVTAYFSSQPVPGYYTASATTVNKVYFNGDSLNYSGTLKYYTFYGADIAAETWSVNGANGIGSFSFTNNYVVPSFSVVGSLPDSVSKSSGFTIVINNVSNITDASFSILDGTNTINGFYSANLSAGNNTITISPANMALLTTTNLGDISITVSNDKAFVFSGKDYQFSREKQMLKFIKIKP